MYTGRGTLLLVGDGRIAAAVEERLRDRLSVEVATAETLEAARERLGDDGVIGVVSNFDVPDTDGIEHLRGLDLLEHARSLDADLPVVLVSTSGNEDIAAEAMARDVTDYILLEGFDDRSTDRLVGRIEYAVEKRLAELRADEQAHIVDVIRDVTDGLVRATTPSEVESTLVDQLTDARPYTGACVTVDDGVVATAGATVDPDVLEALVAARDGALAAWPVDTAAGTVPDDRFPSDALADTAVSSAVAVPISYGDTEYGHLVVLSTRTAIGETEQSVLSELAETAGYAIDAVETKAELERQNERLDEFASLVSHDLRNPLNVISGRVDLLSSDEEHRAAITRSVDRMEQIIEDMLVLARDGTVETDLEPLSLATTAEDVWADFDSDDARFVLSGDRELRADYGALCEIFENLYRNALEHAAEGGLTVTVGPLEDGFFVADDGPGIPEADREQVFEYGYTTDVESTGYGLPIVERIVEAHGWSIRVTAGEAGGARFEITGVE